MTKLEITKIRNTFFSSWIREYLPDSSTGFMVTDVDFLLRNYKTKKVMLLEIKEKGAEIQTWQKETFNDLHKWLASGIRVTNRINHNNWQYLGFHFNGI